MLEEGPIFQIVDAETFRHYLVGYRADRLVDPSVKRLRLTNEDIHSNLNLINIPWADVPESLQRKISWQYDAALLNEEKAVDIILEGGNLQFELRSAHADGLTDTFGEYGAFGLRLQLTSPYGVPLWIVKRIPLPITGSLEDTFFEEDRYIVTQQSQEQPASLIELQDVARLLEKSKDKVVVTTT